MRTSHLIVFFLVVYLLASNSAAAQYMQFSQYNFTTQRVNPAWIGTTSFESFDLITRNQKTGGDFAINTNFASFNYPLINASTGRAWGGIGIAVTDDRSSGIFSSDQISLNYAANIRLSRLQILSLGIKGLYQSERISLNGFYTGAQYVPDRGFDGSLPNNEPYAALTRSYSTFSSGVYWQQTNRDGEVKAYWGASFFDFNQPNNSFLQSASHLPATIVAHGGAEIYRESNWSFFPEFLWTSSAGNNVVNVGARTIFVLNKVIRKQAEHLDLITKYVPGRSGIVGLQVHRENFSLGMSYDFPMLKSNPGNVGAFEVGLSIKKLVKRKIASHTAAQRTKLPARKIGPSKQLQSKSIQQVKRDTIHQSQVHVDSVVQKMQPTISDSSKSVAPSGKGEAGKISSEPLLIEKVTLRFHFEFNSVDLDDETEEFLDNLTVTLEEDPHLKVKITGHTDNVGHEKFNQRLSLKRAQAIKDYLLKKKIAPDRIIAEGKGLNEPVASNETEEGRSKNRRVEISVFKVQ